MLEVNSFAVQSIASTPTDDLFLLPGFRGLQSIRGLNHCTDSKYPSTIRCDRNIVQRHTFEFVCTQELGSHKIIEDTVQPCDIRFR